MGVAKDTLEILNIAIRSIGMKYREIKLCELGNQRMRFGKHKTFKKYLQSMGVDHTSIDINGKDMAKRWDLSKPITKKKGYFDVVTNYGTSEHVKNQENCFKNVHNFCKDGGVMVHLVPLKGTYHGHCDYYYDEMFFKKLANKNDYVIVSSYILKREPDKAIVCVALIKKGGEFEGLS